MKAAMERRTTELLKALSGLHPERFLDVAMETGIMKHLIPELYDTVGVMQPEQHHAFDVYGHLRETMISASLQDADAIVVLAALLHDIGKPVVATTKDDGITPFFPGHDAAGANMVADIADRLKLSKEQKIRLVRMVKNHHDRPHPDWTEKRMKKWVAKIGIENIDDMFVLFIADTIGKGKAYSEKVTNLQAAQATIHCMLTKKPPITVNDLALNGHDLMELGLNGPVIGKVKKQLLDMVLEDPVMNNRTTLMNEALKLTGQQ